MLESPFVYLVVLLMVVTDSTKLFSKSSMMFAVRFLFVFNCKMTHVMYIFWPLVSTFCIVFMFFFSISYLCIHYYIGPAWEF